MLYLLMIVCIFISSCDNNEPKKNSIYSVIDNVIYGNPLTIEIYDKDKISIKIDADTLHKYNEGNTLLFGGVYADLHNDLGEKTSVMYSDTAIIYNKTDSVRAIGNVIVESLKGSKLHAHKIILYNKSKLVKSEENIMLTTNNKDTLYGKGFWSNFDMSNSQILKPIGQINNTKK